MKLMTLLKESKKYHKQVKQTHNNPKKPNPRRISAEKSGFSVDFSAKISAGISGDSSVEISVGVPEDFL